MDIRKLILKIFNNRWFYYRKAPIYQVGDIKPQQNLKEDHNSFEVIFPAELNHIPNLTEISNISPSWPEQFKERLSSGDYSLFLIKKNNSLLYFSWVSFVNEIDRYVNFNSHTFSKEPYLFHCFTFAQHRGIGLHTFATSYLMDYYLKRKRKLWGIIYSNNIPAIKSWEKAGMIKQKNINAFGFFNLKMNKIK